MWVWNGQICKVVKLEGDTALIQVVSLEVWVDVKELQLWEL